MGTTYDINLGGNVTARGPQFANSIDTITAALKAEERALAGTNTALARMQAGSKVDIALVGKAREGALRVGNLRKEAAAIQQANRLEAFYKGSSGAALVSNTLTAKSTDGWKKFGAALRSGASAGMTGLVGGIKFAAVGLAVTTAAAVGLGAVLLNVAKNAITLGVGFADSARSARLLNEAADIAGGTHKQLTGIIEDVRRRSDVSREALGAMARELRMVGFDSRQTQIVLSAMAIAETTLGSSASGAVKGIAEQSRAFRKLTLGARDAYGEYASLRAIGLRKADLFGELARGTGKSIPEIQRMVGAGQVTVKAGMAAIEGALRRKFGGTAQAQAMSLTSQFRRMREDFEGLFSGADIEPLLVGLRSITSIFSQDTASGKAFQAVVSALMVDLGKAAEALGPEIKEAILSLSAEAAKPGGLATTIRGWIQDAKDLGGAIKDIADGIKTIAGAASSVGAAFSWVGERFVVRADQAELDTINKQTRIDRQLADQGKVDGQALTAGIAAGVESGTPDTVGAISRMSAAMRGAFKKDNLIQSPSRTYEREAAYIPAGTARGVDRATPVAVEAVVDMSAAMQGGFKAPSHGSVAASGPIKVELNIYATFSDIADTIARHVEPVLSRVIGQAVERGPSLVTT